jgi:sugar O-acyltransferase (sialic acid O-acetyltransferase NeuD family)
MLAKQLVIIGAGDFAREVLWTSSELPADQRPWRDVRFIDDDLEAARTRLRRCAIDWPISAISEYTPHEDDLLICAIGNPASKLAVCEQLRQKGATFVNIIHPSVAVGPGTLLGTGVIITRFAVLTTGVRIGDFVTINSFSGCGHDAVVEDGCTISAHCDITGHAHLERGVFLGSHAAVMPGVRVGAFAKVAAGSVAFRNVKPGDTVIGVPAKLMM